VRAGGEVAGIYVAKGHQQISDKPEEVSDGEKYSQSKIKTGVFVKTCFSILADQDKLSGLKGAGK